MMMRILHEGGLEIIADADSLKPRKNNAHGIFEIKEYAGFKWLLDHPEKLAGRAVKIVTQYANILEELARKQVPIYAIFMVRSLKEIQASLKAADMKWDPPPAESIALGRRIISHYRIPTMFVNFDAAVKYPASTCAFVREFVDKALPESKLNLDKMVSAIDPTQKHH